MEIWLKRSVAALVILLAGVSQAESQDNFAAKEQQIQQQLTQLDSLLAKANAKNLDVRKQQIAVQVGYLFLRFARWDHVHQDELRNVLKKTPQQILPPERVPEIAAAMPVAQLVETEKLLAAAIQSVRQIIRKPAARVTRNSWPPELKEAKISNGYYRTGGRPILPYSFFWLENSLSREFGQFKNAYIHPAQLKMVGSTPTISREQRQWFKSTLRQNSANQRVSYLFLGHNPPDFFRQPRTGRGTSQFIGYDIDNSQHINWWATLLDTHARDFVNYRNTAKICLMANEPHWFSTRNSWGTVNFSSATKQRFRTYLRVKYEKIETLNRWWRTDYRSFDAIDISFPLDERLRGTGKWYDWCRFNMDRVTHFFAQLKQQVKKTDRQFHVTIKLPSQLLAATSHDHGIDWHALAKVQDILGVDSAIDGWGGVGRFRKNRLDWQGSVFALDFYKSLFPNKLIFDSEWHGFSNIHWRDTSSDGYSLRAKLWLQHLHGLGMNQIWYWGRDKNGRPVSKNQEEFYRSICTSPAAMMSYLETMVDVNDNADVIEKLVSRKRSVALIYSEDSAIHDPGYLKNLLQVYTAAKLQGVGLRIIPLDQLLLDQKIDAASILIPPTKFVLTQHLPILKLATRGKNVAFVSTAGKNGNAFFERDVYGNPIKSKQLSWSKTAKRIDLANTGSEAKLQNFLGVGKFVLRDHDGTPINILQGASDDGKYIWVCNPYRETTKIFLKNQFHDFSGAVDILSQQTIGETMAMDGRNYVRILKIK